MAAPPDRVTSRRTDLSSLAVTVSLSVASMLLVASLQVVLLDGLEPGLPFLVLPALVGIGVGALVALLWRARSGARDALGAVRAREAELSRFETELDDRVQQRTLELERQTDALLRTQRLEVMGRLSAGLAHDFNNILTAIVACTEALREEVALLPPEPRARAAGVLAELDDSAERAVQLTRQFVTLGRSTTLRLEIVDLGALVERMAPMLRRLLGESVELRLPQPGPPARIRADRSQLEQLVLNLAVNGRDAMLRGGVLTIAVVRDGRKAILTVSDTGAGMDEATRARIFDPFFTTKGPGRGTGIGLAVVTEVVRRAAGRIDVQSRPGQGSQFRVTFPATDAQPTPRPGTPRALARLRPLRVLLIEDDLTVRHRLAAALASAGHQVHEAAEPEAAERLALEQAGAIDALVCDLVLPGSSGLELVERLRGRGVGAPVVFISGYTQEEIDERVGALGGAVVLQKPFAPATLLQFLQDAVDGAAATGPAAAGARTPGVTGPA